MILSIGEIVMDETRSETKTIRHLGGAPFNLAANLALAGEHAGFAWALGEDEAGNFLRKRAAFIPFTYLLLLPSKKATMRSLVTITPTGERSFVFPQTDVFPLEMKRFNLKSFYELSIVHLGSLFLASDEGASFGRRIVAEARASGAKVSFDVNYRPGIFQRDEVARARLNEFAEKADYVKMSRDDALYLYGSARERALTSLSATRLVFETDGARGSTLYSPHGCTSLPAKAVKANDATGAGDAYFASVLASLAHLPDALSLSESEGRLIISRANDAGARATKFRGALPKKWS